MSDALRVLLVSNMYPSAEHPHSGIFVAREQQALERAGVETLALPIAGSRGEWDYFASRGRISRAARTFRPHLVHAHFGYTQLATVFLGLPRVVTLYGDDINGESTGTGTITLKSRIGVQVTKTLAWRARRIIVQSDAMLQKLPAGLIAKAVVLGSGVDDEHFSPAPMARARERLGLGQDDLVLAFVNSGRQPTKRLDLAEATRDELVRRGRPARLLVAEQVPADEIQWYYRAADVLLMTSDLEGSPNCVKEALACGTPVVSVPVGDVPDLLTDPPRGIIVDRSPAALAGGVETVIRWTRAPGESLLPPRLRASTVAARLIEIYQAIVADG